MMNLPSRYKAIYTIHIVIIFLIASWAISLIAYDAYLDVRSMSQPEKEVIRVVAECREISDSEVEKERNSPYVQKDGKVFLYITENDVLVFDKPISPALALDYAIVSGEIQKCAR